MGKTSRTRERLLKIFLFNIVWYLKFTGLREITEEQLGSKQIQNNTEKIYNAINETISLYDGYDFA